MWLRFARCVARSVIVVASKFASILIRGLDYSSCVTHSHNPFCARNENVDQLFFHKQKCRNVFPGEKQKKEGFFRKPPAFHRLLFMPPFAGDIGARAGSLKWIAQIPRKAYRWALRGDLKNIFGPKCERSRGRETRLRDNLRGWTVCLQPSEK